MLEYLPKRRLKGGLRLPANKSESTLKPIRRSFIPGQLILSTHQHRSTAAEPVVKVGQHVWRGQPVARASSFDGCDVHASTSGVVTAIEPRLVPSFTNTAEELCIIVDCDGEHSIDESIGRASFPETISERLESIRQAGIVGLGGAVYPTAAKLSAGPCSFLVINGAECEPHISCDDMLMREAAPEILRGTEVIADIVSAEQCIIAIERDKPLAIEAMHEATSDGEFANILMAELASIYPAGGERQLIDVLTGAEVPSDQFPSDIGYICQNVGTAYAVQQLVEFGLPLCSRIVTVSGSAVAEPQNVEVPIGTPISELIDSCGGYAGEPYRLIHGGSMMGYALPSDAIPVTKATNCIVVASRDEVRTQYTEWPCIRCGECSIVCPVRLLPQDLLTASRVADMPSLDTLGLTDCIECGCCDVICPSHIPLTETFRQAKRARSRSERQRELSATSDARYQQHVLRQQEGFAKTEALQHSLRSGVSTEDDDQRSAAIDAAVARTRQRKQQPPE